MAAARPFYSQVPRPRRLPYSAIFKNNFTMLGFVFATGFAFE
ncbi:hypothetical protein CSHISOI_09806, partial [Colletotrichum shisoi]